MSKIKHKISTLATKTFTLVNIMLGYNQIIWQYAPFNQVDSKESCCSKQQLFECKISLKDDI